MTQTQNIVAKLSVAFVTASMLFMLVSPAKADTVSDLQAQIAALMAQINSLQSSVGSTTGGSCVSIPAPLTMGSTGADVTALQNFLISAGQVIPAGATGYFGSQTQSALAGWQAAHGVAPAVGYYGPITKAAMDAACVPTTPTTPTDGGSTGSTDTTLSGEADLDDVIVDDADDDTIQEGADDAELGMVTIIFKNGDARVDRLDVALQGGDDETDPWDTFDSVSLWVDGDKIAEMDASSKKDYLDEDDGSLRFTGLDLVAKEDEEVEVTVAANIQSGMDDGNDGEDWSLFVGSMRYFDADDVATTDDSTGDLDDTYAGTSADFTIEEAGADDQIIVKSNSADPDATTLEVMDDQKSDWYTVFVFDLDTKDSSNDLDLNHVKVNVDFGTGEAYNTFVDDAELILDGTTIGSTASDVTNGASTTAAATIDFDVDGDVTIDAGDRVKAELRLRFKSLDSSDEGQTFSASITGNTTNIDAEGADDVTDVTGTASSETHTLRTSGVAVDNLDSTETASSLDTADSNYGTFDLTFDVTAIGDDEVFIPLTAAAVFASGSTTKGAIFSVRETTSGATTTSDSLSSSLTRVSGGDSSTSGYVRLDSGDTATLKLSVVFNPATAAGQYVVTLDNVGFNPTASTVSLNRTTLTPTTDYDTDPLFIQS